MAEDSDARYVEVVHAIPGRTRLRVSWRQSPADAAELAAELRRREGVLEVEVRPRTGSVLCQHDPERLPATGVVAAVSAITGARRVLQPGEQPPAPAPLPPRGHTVIANELSALFADMDDHIRRATGGRVDLGTLTTLTLLGLGAGDVAVRGELPLPPWFNLAWWSFRTFVTFERENGGPGPEADAADAADDAD